MFDFDFLRRMPVELFTTAATPRAPRAVRSWPTQRGGGALAGEPGGAAQGACAPSAAAMWADDEHAEALPPQDEVPPAPLEVQQATPVARPGPDSAFDEARHDEKRGLASVEALTEHGKVSAKLVGQDFTLRFPPGMPDADRQRLAHDALRTLGITVNDPDAFAKRLAAGEDVIKVKRELEVATPAEAAAQARRLFDMKVVGDEEFDANAASWDEQTLRTLRENGDNGYEGKCTSASERWQKLMAARGKYVPVKSHENGAATGHRYLVPEGGGVIIDPTFGQFFQGKWTELDGGKSQYEPFIGTYPEMLARVQQAIDAGLMKDFAPGSDAAAAIEAGWGIQKGRGRDEGFELMGSVGEHEDVVEGPTRKELAQP